MFKIVVVGGKLRGQEFPLVSGENIIGRDSSNQIVLAIDGISKKHLKLTVMEDTVYAEDLKSSNGTLVNGKIVTQMTLVGNEQITLPNVVLQLVHVKEIKKIIKKKVVREKDEQTSSESIPSMPENIFGKVIHIFKYRMMPIVYTFNKEYEWHSITSILLVIYILITISLTIFPVLGDSRRVLLEEIKARGLFYASVVEQVSRVNLARRNFDIIDINFLNNEPGVESYDLYDPEGRIIRPVERLNNFIQDTFSIAAKEAFTKEEKDKGTDKPMFFAQGLGDGKIGIAKLIMSYDLKKTAVVPVGIIAIKFAPTSLGLEASNNKKAYLESFFTSILVGIIFFAVLYFLTIKHFEDLRWQVENIMRGKQKEIVSNYLFSESKSFINSINTILLRYSELQSAGQESNMESVEEDSKYIQILKEFLLGAAGPAIILNSEKLVQNINLMAEDLTGMREAASTGMSLLDIARDQGFAATLIDLCDQSASNEGRTQKGSYELSGKAYNLNVTSLIGKDGFAKAFWITFVKDE